MVQVITGQRCSLLFETFSPLQGILLNHCRDVHELFIHESLDTDEDTPPSLEICCFGSCSYHPCPLPHPKPLAESSKTRIYQKPPSTKRTNFLHLFKWQIGTRLDMVTEGPILSQWRETFLHFAKQIFVLTVGGTTVLNTEATNSTCTMEPYQTLS